MHDIDRTYLELSPEFGAQETYEQSQESFEYGEFAGEYGEVFNEEEILELASELLEIQSEAELNHFLGGLIKRAASAVGSVIKSPVGQALGGVLKSAAKQALPMVGSAAGGYFGGATGAKLGSQLASGAGRAFGLEAEGIGHEDEAYEAAKQYVRFAGNAVQNAVTAAPGDPRAIAQAAVNRAASLLPSGLSPSRGRAGRWVRRGNRIILYGV